jgi:hypothetical protein
MSLQVYLEIASPTTSFEIGPGRASWETTPKPSSDKPHHCVLFHLVQFILHEIKEKLPVLYRIPILDQKLRFIPSLNIREKLLKDFVRNVVSWGFAFADKPLQHIFEKLHFIESTKLSLISTRSRKTFALNKRSYEEKSFSVDARKRFSP